MEVGELGTPKLTALTCMYEKPPEVMREVLDGISHADEAIAILDRPSQPALIEITKSGEGNLRFAVLDGPLGWRSPCLSWNAGMRHVTGDQLLILQGDVVLAAASAQKAREFLRERPAVYFGKVTESKPEMCTGPGHAGPILCSSERPRPLTYLLAVPTEAVRAIGGWDEAFQAGAWYEDDDFTIRLWQHGLDFIFDDRISGVHQSHERSYAKPIAIATNQAIFLQKHGTLRFWDREVARGKLKVERQPGSTCWRHA